MKVVIVANDQQRSEWSQGAGGGEGITWTSDPGNIKSGEILVDLLFDGSAERINLIKARRPELAIVNSVEMTTEEMEANFARVNGWNSFLSRPFIEAAVRHEESRPVIEAAFSLLNRKVEWVPDIAGFITPRVIASIINEAYYALEEEVSSKQEIDTAMKLGTNYPYGPFEWAEKIGVGKVYRLLKRLEREEDRYQPCGRLEKEALG